MHVSMRRLTSCLPPRRPPAAGCRQPPQPAARPPARAACSAEGCGPPPPPPPPRLHPRLAQALPVTRPRLCVSALLSVWSERFTQRHVRTNWRVCTQRQKKIMVEVQLKRRSPRPVHFMCAQHPEI